MACRGRQPTWACRTLTSYFAKAVAHAPQTRPGRYTILERLAMSEEEIADRVEEYAGTIAG